MSKQELLSLYGVMLSISQRSLMISAAIIKDFALFREALYALLNDRFNIFF